MDDATGLVLVVPCFREADRWDVAYWEQVLALADIGWVFVDDGSPDGTAARLEGLARDHGVETLLLPRNVGKAEAVRAGMRWALDHRTSARMVGFMDADGAFPPHEVARLRDVVARTDIEAFDAVWASRVALAGRRIERRAARHYVGRVVATYLFHDGVGPPYDSQCGWKAFRPSPALRSALEAPFLTRWLFEVELIARWPEAAGAALRVREEPVEAWRDIAGSRITRREVVRLTRELRIARRLLRRSRGKGATDRTRATGAG